MRAVLLFCVALVIAGCDSGKAPTSAPAAPGKPAPVRPAGFKEAAAAFLDEARAGAKLMTQSPTAEQMRNQAEKVAELYAALPPVPADVDRTGDVKDKLKRINSLIDVAAKLVDAASEAVRAGDAAAAKKVMTVELPVTAKGVTGFADEVEAKLKR
jgi:hypothetical protein